MAYRSLPNGIIVLWTALYQAGGGRFSAVPCVRFYIAGGMALYGSLCSVFYSRGGGRLSTVPCVRFYIAEGVGQSLPSPVFGFI